MTLYEDKGFQVVPQFIPPFFAQYLKNYFDLLYKNDQVCNEPPDALGHFDDGKLANSVGIYGNPAFDMLMLMSLPLVEEIVGKKLLPTYTYARIYFNDSNLLPHLDREECEHSVSLCLGGEYEALWPLWFKDGDKEPEYAAMSVGDAVIYKGNKIHHWRDEFQGQKQFQVFMHYVEADGDYKDKLYDTRPYLGLPANTKK